MALVFTQLTQDIFIPLLFVVFTLKENSGHMLRGQVEWVN